MKKKLLKLLLESGKKKSKRKKGGGRYVIVRCKDAGVHAGELVAYEGREATLKKSRRLWYWKPLNGAAFLSGVANYGLHEDSKVGAAVNIVLTETCEIIDCTPDAARSIDEAPEHQP